MSDPKPIATFTKDGKTREAYTRADVVKFRFEGWQEKTAAKAPSRNTGAKKPGAKKAPAKKPGAKAATPTAPAAGTNDPPTPQ